jgi:predicted nucleic acid-binding protein
MRCVLDASLAVCWCIEDEQSAATDKILDEIDSGGSAIVPALWIWEIGNVLMLAERKKRMSEKMRREQLAMLKGLGIEIDEFSTSQAWTETTRLAQIYGLSVYDAAYLELALRLNLPLGTLDRDLRKAATEAGVTCLPEKM